MAALLDWASAPSRDGTDLPIVWIGPTNFQSAFADAGFSDLDVETIDFGPVVLQIALKIKIPDIQQDHFPALQQVLAQQMAAATPILPQHLQDATSLTRF